MNDFLPYVMPITRRSGDERSFAGTAFCVDDYLITAGHVIDRTMTYYVRNGSTYHELRHDLWIPAQLPDFDRYGFDVAIYPIPGLKSPLRLADEDTEPDTSLNVACWQIIHRRSLQRVNTQCLVLRDDESDGYRRIATVDRITHGASGCPVFDDDGNVYGLLSMGRDHVDDQGLHPLKRALEQNTCWIFTTSHIRRFLP